MLKELLSLKYGLIPLKCNGCQWHFSELVTTKRGGIGPQPIRAHNFLAFRTGKNNLRLKEASLQK